MNNRVCQFCGFVIPLNIKIRDCCINGKEDDIFNYNEKNKIYEKIKKINEKNKKR